MGIDLCDNKIMFNKVYFSRHGHVNFTTDHVIQLIKKGITQEHKMGRFVKTEKLIIHTDKGPQFCSHKFVNFINGVGEDHPIRLLGSQTPGGSPLCNSVAERIFNTLKNQLPTLIGPFPKEVEATRGFGRFIDRKCKAYNRKYIAARNLGAPPDAQHKILIETEVAEPEHKIAKYNDSSKSQPGVAEAEIIKYKLDTSVASDPPDIASMRHDQLLENQLIIANQNDVTHLRLEKIENKIDRILPKKKSVHKAIIDRDPVPNKLLEEIMGDIKPKGCHPISWPYFKSPVFC